MSHEAWIRPTRAKWSLVLRRRADPSARYDDGIEFLRRRLDVGYAGSGSDPKSESLRAPGRTSAIVSGQPIVRTRPSRPNVEPAATSIGDQRRPGPAPVSDAVTASFNHTPNPPRFRASRPRYRPTGLKVQRAATNRQFVSVARAAHSKDNDKRDDSAHTGSYTSSRDRMAPTTERL